MLLARSVMFGAVYKATVAVPEHLSTPRLLADLGFLLTAVTRQDASRFIGLRGSDHQRFTGMVRKPATTCLEMPT